MANTYTQIFIHAVFAVKYRNIRGQIEHHLGVSFIEEYHKLLNKNKVDYEEKYIFKELE